MGWQFYFNWPIIHVLQGFGGYEVNEVCVCISFRSTIDIMGVLQHKPLLHLIINN